MIFVFEQAGIDEGRQLLVFSCRAVFGDVSNDRGADAQIKQSVITSDRENQNPDAISGIAEPVQNYRRQENSDQHVRSQRRPTGADIL